MRTVMLAFPSSTPTLGKLQIPMTNPQGSHKLQSPKGFVFRASSRSQTQFGNAVVPETSFPLGGETEFRRDVRSQTEFRNEG